MLAIGSPCDNDVLDLIQNIIDTISSGLYLPKHHADSRQKVKTTYECALDLFISRGKVGVSYSSLKQLVTDSCEASDIDKATRKLISRLREKVEDQGYILVYYRPQEDRQPYYFIMHRPI